MVFDIRVTPPFIAGLDLLYMQSYCCSGLPGSMSHTRVSFVGCVNQPRPNSLNLAKSRDYLDNRCICNREGKPNSIMQGNCLEPHNATIYENLLRESEDEEVWERIPSRGGASQTPNPTSTIITISYTQIFPPKKEPLLKVQPPLFGYLPPPNLQRLEYP
ncbi:hypothetical protein VNO77_41857 [Canavalia gladiata]|uniref:Uncharacterized protein n=1 Tax=Canavalia gladiata TaxID=3824 RepID=A0AAN9PQI3_CANGL